jgi:lysophospholipase L1-like esterase
LRRGVVAGGAIAVAAVVGLAGDKGGAAGRSCNAADCANLVFDGDSISAGWGASPGHGLDVRVAAELGDAVRLRNVAVGGRPVSECLRLYRKLVAPLFVSKGRANVIVFHAGDNDIAQGRSAAQTYAAFTDYVAAAHQQGWKVVVSTELRRLDFSLEKAAELAAYNDRLRTNTAGADAVVDFDANPQMVDPAQRSDPALFSRDGIHPGNGGCSLLAGMLAPAVKRVAGRVP